MSGMSSGTEEMIHSSIYVGGMWVITDWFAIGWVTTPFVYILISRFLDYFYFCFIVGICMLQERDGPGVNVNHLAKVMFQIP